jgi:DeoC/LacD family aldolase
VTRRRSESSIERIYPELCGDHPIDLCRFQVANCFMGRIGLINSGGPSGRDDLRQAVATAVINKRAGGMGLTSGRKAFQRPMGWCVPAERHPGRVSESGYYYSVGIMSSLKFNTLPEEIEVPRRGIFIQLVLDLNEDLEFERTD